MVFQFPCKVKLYTEMKTQKKVSMPHGEQWLPLGSAVGTVRILTAAELILLTGTMYSWTRGVTHWQSDRLAHKELGSSTNAGTAPRVLGIYSYYLCHKNHPRHNCSVQGIQICISHLDLTWFLSTVAGDTALLPLSLKGVALTLISRQAH